MFAPDPHRHRGSRQRVLLKDNEKADEDNDQADNHVDCVEIHSDPLNFPAVSLLYALKQTAPPGWEASGCIWYRLRLSRPTLTPVTNKARDVEDSANDGELSQINKHLE